MIAFVWRWWLEYSVCVCLSVCVCVCVCVVCIVIFWSLTPVNLCKVSFRHQTRLFIQRITRTSLTHCCSTQYYDDADGDKVTIHNLSCSLIVQR